MIDENAFGIYLSWLSVEDEEYGLEPAEFADRLQEFRETVMEYVCAAPLGDGLSVLDMGHAVYLEIADGDQSADVFGWLRRAQTAVLDAGFTTFGVLTHGSRWVADEANGESESSEEEESDAADPIPSIDEAGGTTWVRFSHSSEPLRRALFVESAARSDADNPGWGAGLYLDAEALDALGKKLKNSPTPLRIAGATYFRIGS